MASPETNENVSFNLWALLWLATFFQIFQILWAILLTAKLPPGCQFPTQWADTLGHGPNAMSYWVYEVVLVANILWETRFKGSKTYVPSGFPFPDMLYSNIALGLWAVLWVLARMGSEEGWFAMPDWLGLTLKTSLFLWFAQGKAIKVLRNPEGFLQKLKEAFKDDSERPVEEKPPVGDRPTPAPTPQTNAAVSPAKLAPKQTALNKGDLNSKLLDHVRQNGQTKTGALVTALGSPRRSVIRSLNKLIEDGHLVREGSGAGAVYRVSDVSK